MESSDTKTIDGANKYKVWMNKHPILSIFILLFFLGALIDFVDGPAPAKASDPAIQATAPTQATPLPSKPADTISAQKAKDELNSLMALSKKADLVTSFEFSETGNIVYVGNAWYAQTVPFKKDFIAKVGTLKKAITGFTNFKLRDGHSNELVGEITAFSQSIEVYK